MCILHVMKNSQFFCFSLRSREEKNFPRVVLCCPCGHAGFDGGDKVIAACRFRVNACHHYEVLLKYRRPVTSGRLPKQDGLSAIDTGADPYFNASHRYSNSSSQSSVPVHCSSARRLSTSPLSVTLAAIASFLVF